MPAPRIWKQSIATDQTHKIEQKSKVHFVPILVGELSFIITAYSLLVANSDWQKENNQIECAIRAIALRSFNCELTGRKFVRFSQLKFIPIFWRRRQPIDFQMRAFVAHRIEWRSDKIGEKLSFGVDWICRCREMDKWKRENERKCRWQHENIPRTAAIEYPLTKSRFSQSLMQKSDYFIASWHTVFFRMEIRNIRCSGNGWNTHSTSVPTSNLWFRRCWVVSNIDIL